MRSSYGGTSLTEEQRQICELARAYAVEELRPGIESREENEDRFDRTPVDAITPSVEGFDHESETWTTIITGAAIAAVGFVQLKIGLGLTAAANTIVNHEIPSKFRFSMAVADTDSMTYTVGLNIINR